MSRGPSAADGPELGENLFADSIDAAGSARKRRSALILYVLYANPHGSPLIAWNAARQARARSIGKERWAFVKRWRFRAISALRALLPHLRE
jgi:hypothetical protein